MYQSHDAKIALFRTITRLSGDFLVPYHQDVPNLLKEKTEAGGNYRAMTTLRFWSVHRRAESQQPYRSWVINAFPKLMRQRVSRGCANSTRNEKVIKDRMQAGGCPVAWQEKRKSRVLTIAHAEAMKESCREVLGTPLTPVSRTSGSPWY